MPAHCPAENELTAFRLGTLDPARAEPLSEHVEHCTRCQDNLETASHARDSVVHALKQRATPANTESPVRKIAAAVLNNDPWRDPPVRSTSGEEATIETSSHANSQAAEATAEFDPLYVWLGISPNEQPPDNYRLLGVAQFEANADVISSAADRQMAHVRTFQTGQRGAFAQKLLTRISAARVCLLNAQKKAEYDEQLRKQVPASGISSAASDDLPAQPTSSDEYQQIVVGLGLMSEAKLKSYLAGLPTAERPADMKALAHGLVDDGHLTNFQAASIYQGKWRHLVLGDYVMLERIGGGGMGDVYKALHRRMRVLRAIKVIKPELVDSQESVQRFHREVLAAAQLSHPNIVAAHDAGEDKGQHYLVMEFIDGDDLGDIVKQRGPLPVDVAIDFIMQAARGLGHAHQKGTVHRDVKPGNLLLDGDGAVKVSDLGLARLDADRFDVGDDDGETYMTTSDGKILGTVDFMAPEQAEDTHTVDHRADIYSLGCTLYRLLTGASPYSTGTTNQRMMAHRNAPLPKLRDHCPEAPAAVEEVFARMCAKVPENRPQTMDEVVNLLETCVPSNDSSPLVPAPVVVAEDPQRRHLRKRSPLRQRLATFHNAPPIMIASGAAALLLIVGLFATFAMVLTFRTPQGTFEVQVDGDVAPDVEVVAKQGGEVIEVASEKNDWTLRLKEGEYQLEVRGGGDDKFKIDKQVASITRDGKEIVRLSRKPDEAVVPAETVADNATAEPATMTPIREFSGHTRLVHAVAFLPEGKRFLSVSDDSTLRIWDVEGGDEVRKIGLPGGSNYAIAVSPDGKLAAAVVSAKSIVLCDLAAGEIITRLEGHADRINSLDFSSDSKLLVSRSKDETARIWDVAEQKEIEALDFGSAMALARFIPDGHRWFTTTGDLVKVREVGDEQQQGRARILAESATVSLAVSDDGALAAAGGYGDKITIVSLADLSRVAVFQTDKRATDLAFLPGTHLLVSGSFDKTVRVWNAEKGTELVRGTLPKYGTNFVAVSPDGRHIVTGGGFSLNDRNRYDTDGDYKLRLWDLPESVWPDKDRITLERRLEGQQKKVFAIGYDPDGKFALASSGEVVHVWDVDAGRPLRQFAGHRGTVYAVAITPDGKLAATGDSNKSVILWNPATGEEIRRFEGFQGVVGSLSFSPDGRQLAASGMQEEIVLWDTASGDVARRITERSGRVFDVAFSPTGRFLSEGATDGGVRVWNTASGKLLHREGLQSGATRVAWSPDESRLAAYCESGEIHILQTAPFRVLHKLKAEGRGWGLEFTPDGRHLVSGAMKTLQVWNVRTGEEVARHNGSAHYTQRLDISPDGRHVLSGGGEYTRQEDGKWIYEGDGDYDLRLWRLP